LVHRLIILSRPRCSQPTVFPSNVAQLLAYPFGKLLDHVLPDWGFTLYGVRHSLNPGPFTRKEHMLITIMANVASGTPYTNNIIWIQYLKRYFNQPYAGRFAYQILVALSTNLIGYGMAGVTRRFLVYPVYCVWPASLSTIALNTAFHSRENEPVEGPGGRIFRISRYKFFLLAMAAMFVYFWFPDNLFLALSKFSWITWIAPNNVALTAVAGFNNGLGFNPWPTFDWNTLGFNGPDPLMVPWFSTANRFFGSLISAFVILGVWFSNSFFTGYLPINDNHVYDNTASPYNVSLALDKKGWLDPAKYESYSPAYLCAGNLVVYLFFFAVYPAILMVSNGSLNQGGMLLMAPVAHHLEPSLRGRDGVQEPRKRFAERQDRDAQIYRRPQPSDEQICRR
jgi:OPT family oligopeptide transporter